jgi:hypothetical protein
LHCLFRKAVGLRIIARRALQDGRLLAQCLHVIQHVLHRGLAVAFERYLDMSGVLNVAQ